MKRILSLISMILFVVLTTIGCQTPQQAENNELLSDERTKELQLLSDEFTKHLNNNDIQAAMAMMDENMKGSMDGKLEDVWGQLTSSLGQFVETGNYIGTSSDDYEALEMTLIFEKGKMVQRIVFSKENLITGLWYRNGEVESAGNNQSDKQISDNIQEITVTIDAGEGYPLEGLFTLPSSGDPAAVVVMLQGSGPSDRNETIGGNAPFRDIAHALAEKGIATLRYDKRTYTHGEAIASSPDIAKLTIDEEVVNDAVAAVNLLKSQEGIDKDKIYLLGHSMGGGLLSYINSKGADCAGYIIMAGTPRNMWELSAEQNLLVADEFEESGKLEEAEEIRAFVQQETQRASNLAKMTDEEALKEENALFGMSAWYLRKFEEIDSAALHNDDKKPVLVLQGEKDRQVTMADFQLWKEKLADHPNAEFISYPDLNHIFGNYKGDPVPFTQMVNVEYAQETPVAEDVTNDIASWILK